MELFSQIGTVCRYNGAIITALKRQHTWNCVLIVVKTKRWFVISPLFMAMMLHIHRQQANVADNKHVEREISVDIPSPVV